MANSYSTQDCVKGALQRVGELTDGSSTYHQLALKYVNQTHKDIIKGNSVFAPDVREAWTWARQTAALSIPSFYQTGTVSLTLNSTAGTFSVAPTISLAGYFLNITNLPTFYKIATHVAGSPNFTLDLAFLDTQASITTALSFRALPLIVDLYSAAGLTKGIQRLVEPLRIYLQRVLEFGETAQDMGRVYGMDPIQFWKEYPLQLILNDTPSKFVTIFKSENSWQIQFNKYTTNAMRADFDYIQVPDDLEDSSSSIPLVPRDDRDTLEMGAAYYLFVDKKQKEDAQLMFSATAAKINALKEQERSSEKFYGSIYGQIVPRRDDTAIPYWIIQK